MLACAVIDEVSELAKSDLERVGLRLQEDVGAKGLGDSVTRREMFLAGNQGEELGISQFRTTTLVFSDFGPVWVVEVLEILGPFQKRPIWWLLVGSRRLCLMVTQSRREAKRIASVPWRSNSLYV